MVFILLVGSVILETPGVKRLGMYSSTIAFLIVPSIFSSADFNKSTTYGAVFYYNLRFGRLCAFR